MRRLQADLILCYKILTENVSVNCQEFFIFSSSTNLRSSNRNTNSKKLILPRSRIDIRQFFFASRVINIWNCLPNEIVCSNTVQSFRTNIRKYDLTNYISGVRVGD